MSRSRVLMVVVVIFVVVSLGIDWLIRFDLIDAFVCFFLSLIYNFLYLFVLLFVFECVGKIPNQFNSGQIMKKIKRREREDFHFCYYDYIHTIDKHSHTHSNYSSMCHTKIKMMIIKSSCNVIYLCLIYTLVSRVKV